MSARTCHDCGARPGENHKPGCDVERCPLCGGQRLSCGCEHEVSDYPAEVAKCGGPLPWTGEWPGDAECREMNLYAKLIPGRGWVSCAKDDPEATEDLNSLSTVARWDRAARRWVPRGNVAQ